MRILVTGSREWVSEMYVWGMLDELVNSVWLADGQVTLVHGACPKGVDLFANNWAVHNHRLRSQYPGNGSVAIERYPADWKMGRMAGRWRNQHMVNLGADVCVAFIRDHSPGASHCVQWAHIAGIPITPYYDCNCHDEEGI